MPQHGGGQAHHETGAAQRQSEDKTAGGSELDVAPAHAALFDEGGDEERQAQQDAQQLGRCKGQQSRQCDEDAEAVGDDPLADIPHRGCEQQTGKKQCGARTGNTRAKQERYPHKNSRDNSSATDAGDNFENCRMFVARIGCSVTLLSLHSRTFPESYGSGWA